MQRVSDDLAVLADAAGLRMVLGNLLNNALDAMPQGGLLSVSVRRDAGIEALVVTGLSATVIS